MSSRSGSSKKGQNEALTELTDKFYEGEEEPESTGQAALQSDPQAIYVSLLKEALILLTSRRNQRYRISEKM